MATVLTVLFALPSAAAGFGVSSVSLTPSDPRAGAHSDLTFKIAFDQSEQKVRDLTTELPVGVLGDPTSSPQCTRAQLNSDTCPPGSQIGSTVAQAGLDLLPWLPPIPADGTVYNMVAPPDRPARFGVVLRPLGGLLGKLQVETDIDVRDATDYGLILRIKDMPTQLAGLGIFTQSLELKLFGRAASGGFYSVNPTQCNPAVGKVEVNAWADPTPRRAEFPFQVGDCANVPFSPAMTLQTEDPRPDRPSGTVAGLKLPANENDRQSSHVSHAEVVLPDGFALNPGRGPGLEICTREQFGPPGDVVPACPEASKVGTVKFDSPLLPGIEGTVFFGREPGHPYQIYIYAHKRGVTVKLIANTTLDDNTGRVTTTLPNLPQVPFTNFELAFEGGPKSVLVTPETCGRYEATATLTPWSGNPPKTISTQIEVADSPGGGCNPVMEPSISGSTSTTDALKPTAVQTDVGRSETSRPPRTIEVKMPRGLVGRIKDVPPCPDSMIESGCPASSRVGSAVSRIGSGPETVPLNGEAFLAGKTDDAIARLVITTRAAVGPFDLGNFTIVSPLRLGETDGRVTVDSAIPRAFKGFPVRLRALELKIDRPDFMLNASGCDARQYDVTMKSVDGASGSSSGPYQATHCERLGFSPTVQTRVDDRRVRRAGSQIPFTEELRFREGDAAASDIATMFPKGLLPNIPVLRNYCHRDEWEARACPAFSQIGIASAKSPLIDDELTGPVYLVESNGNPLNADGLILPSAAVQLRAPGVRMRLEGYQRQARESGRVEAHFTGLPDVPLQRFTMHLFGPQKGQPAAIKAGWDLCDERYGPFFTSMIDGSGRKVVKTSVLDAAACRPGPVVSAVVLRINEPRPGMRIGVRVGPGMTSKMRRVALKLPPGITLRRGAIARSARIAYGGSKKWLRAGSRLKVTGSRGLLVRMPKKGSDFVRIELRRGSLKTTAAVRRRAASRQKSTRKDRRIRTLIAADVRDAKNKRWRNRQPINGFPD